MTILSQKTCSACEIGAPLVPNDKQIQLLSDLDGWDIDYSGTSKLNKEFKFINYEDSVKFVNLIVDLAASENHHPKIILEWGSVKLEWWSHKIKGLHMNDFICAAKSDELFNLFEK